MGLSARGAALAIAVVVIVAAVIAYGPIAQDPSYHAFADRRTILGMPNALDVLSNIGFVLVGIAGLMVARSAPYIIFFVAATLTGFGSAYYHLAPGDARLVWDRLPMAVAFMALLTALIEERIGARRWLLAPIVIVGALSVMYWSWTGDLRFYVIVQYGSVVMILLLVALYPRHAEAKYLAAALVLYIVAKLFELADARIFEFGHIVSGHTLKHVFAAAGIGCIALMARARAR